MSATEQELSPIRVWVELEKKADPNGSGPPTAHIRTTPNPFHVGPGQPLLFECAKPFGVQFVGRTPLDGELVDPRDRANRPWEGAPECELEHGLGQWVRPDAAGPEKFKYIIAVYDAELGVVHIADPEGVVDPDPKGPGKAT